MKATLKNNVLTTSTLSLDLKEVVAINRTDLTLVGWCWIMGSISFAIWIHHLGFLWWASGLVAILLVLMPPFLVPLSKMKIYTRNHSITIRGTTSHLMDHSEEICEYLANRSQ